MAPKLSNSHNELLFCLILYPALIKFASSSAFVPIEEFSTDNEEESVPSIVTVRNGQIRGFRRELEPALDAEKVLFEQADIFLGIPFAQPPVDELRLERPLAASNWTGTLDATALPAPCVPQQLLTALNFDENCLQLNVMRPASVPSGDASSYQFPVLVFIHGGAFIIGGTFVEGYANISNNFVAQGIVVVTVQYRLNFLGFFTDGTERNPGNLGLWDQRQALLWVRDNIGAFGGASVSFGRSFHYANFGRGAAESGARVARVDHVNKGHAKLLPFPGVAHTAEYAFTLGVPLLGNYALDEEDKNVRATMAHAYGTFVKNGVPNTLNDETNWPRLGSDRRQPLQLTRIKYPKPVTETEPTDVAEKLKFWRKLSTLKGYGGMTGFAKELP
uniref:Carboxylesterase type B domain-containing protein n=1 Tax=Globodera rostochiensis TaxID=31243 RepID=A0A914IA09_GLORO